MLPILSGDGANASSLHGPGRRARQALDDAHERLAAVIGADAREIVFTGGGTEAINLALKGAAWAGKAAGRRIITSAVEHKAVLESCQYLEKFGFDVVVLPVDRHGRLEPDTLSEALNEKVILVSLQLANNEVGTIQPVSELIARVRAETTALVHVDAVQGAAYLPLDVVALDADMVSLAAHKLEGPKGVGAMWLRRGRAILPQTSGGSQERYRRAGTENVAGAVGMAVAFELNAAERPETTVRLATQREILHDAIAAVEDVEMSGHPFERLPGLLSLVVSGVSGDDVVIALDLGDIAVSTGSACTTGSTEPSHVLTAMGYPPQEAHGSLRISMGRTTTTEDVHAASVAIPEAIAQIRAGAARLVDGARDRTAVGVTAT